MSNWPRNVLLVVLLVCVAPSHAHAEPVSEAISPAQADSLIWYIEALERDLAIRDAPAYVDSLEIRLELLTIEVEGLRDRQTHWYHDPRLWFLAGATAFGLVFGLSANVAF